MKNNLNTQNTASIATLISQPAITSMIRLKAPHEKVRKVLYMAGVVCLLLLSSKSMAQVGNYIERNQKNDDAVQEDYNTVLGFEAGAHSMDGLRNTFLGAQAGRGLLSDAYNNTCIGYYSGGSTSANGMGVGNTFLGAYSGENSTGRFNTYLGSKAGTSNITGQGNVFVGASTGFDNTGDYNTFIGSNAGENNDNGHGNVFIGFYAGFNNYTGEGNVFIGHYVGFSADVSDKLYIDNSNTSSPLIYGDFAGDIVTINGDMGIGTDAPSEKLEVVGNIKATAFEGVFNPTANIDLNSFKLIGGGEEGLSIDVDGNLGIGTDTPTEKLHVEGGNISTSGVVKSEGTEPSYFQGNVGIGTDAPTEKLHVEGGNISTSGVVKSEGTEPSYFQGNVGIGTDAPGNYKLAVEGNIGAREVEVTPDAWADFVFEDTYTLPALEEVEAHINIHKHLPGVPSAQEVLDNGIELGAMNATLLQKIEELTLYVIALKKELEEVKSGK